MKMTSNTNLRRRANHVSATPIHPSPLLSQSAPPASHSSLSPSTVEQRICQSLDENNGKYKRGTENDALSDSDQLSAPSLLQTTENVVLMEIDDVVADDDDDDSFHGTMGKNRYAKNNFDLQSNSNSNSNSDDEVEDDDDDDDLFGTQQNNHASVSKQINVGYTQPVSAMSLRRMENANRRGSNFSDEESHDDYILGGNGGSGNNNCEDDDANNYEKKGKETQMYSCKRSTEKRNEHRDDSLCETEGKFMPSCKEVKSKNNGAGGSDGGSVSTNNHTDSAGTTPKKAIFTKDGGDVAEDNGKKEKIPKKIMECTNDGEPLFSSSTSAEIDAEFCWFQTRLRREECEREYRHRIFERKNSFPQTFCALAVGMIVILTWCREFQHQHNALGLAEQNVFPRIQLANHFHPLESRYLCAFSYNHPRYAPSQLFGAVEPEYGFWILRLTLFCSLLFFILVLRSGRLQQQDASGFRTVFILFQFLFLAAAATLVDSVSDHARTAGIIAVLVAAHTCCILDFLHLLWSTLLLGAVWIGAQTAMLWFQCDHLFRTATTTTTYSAVNSTVTNMESVPYMVTTTSVWRVPENQMAFLASLLATSVPILFVIATVLIWSYYVQKSARLAFIRLLRECEHMENTVQCLARARTLNQQFAPAAALSRLLSGADAPTPIFSSKLSMPSNFGAMDVMKITPGENSSVLARSERVFYLLVSLHGIGATIAGRRASAVQRLLNLFFGELDHIVNAHGLRKISACNNFYTATLVPPSLPCFNSARDSINNNSNGPAMEATAAAARAVVQCSIEMLEFMRSCQLVCSGMHITANMCITLGSGQENFSPYHRWIHLLSRQLPMGVGCSSTKDTKTYLGGVCAVEAHYLHRRFLVPTTDAGKIVFGREFLGLCKYLSETKPFLNLHQLQPCNSTVTDTSVSDDGVCIATYSSEHDYRAWEQRDVSPLVRQKKKAALPVFFEIAKLSAMPESTSTSSNSFSSSSHPNDKNVEMMEQQQENEEENQDQEEEEEEEEYDTDDTNSGTDNEKLTQTEERNDIASFAAKSKMHKVRTLLAATKSMLESKKTQLLKKLTNNSRSPNNGCETKENCPASNQAANAELKNKSTDGAKNDRKKSLSSYNSKNTKKKDAVQDGKKEKEEEEEEEEEIAFVWTTEELPNWKLVRYHRKVQHRQFGDNPGVQWMHQEFCTEKADIFSSSMRHFSQYFTSPPFACAQTMGENELGGDGGAKKENGSTAKIWWSEGSSSSGDRSGTTDHISLSRLQQKQHYSHQKQDLQARGGGGGGDGSSSETSDDSDNLNKKSNHNRAKLYDTPRNSPLYKRAESIKNTKMNETGAQAWMDPALQRCELGGWTGSHPEMYAKEHGPAIFSYSTWYPDWGCVPVPSLLSSNLSIFSDVRLWYPRLRRLPLTELETNAHFEIWRYGYCASLSVLACFYAALSAIMLLLSNSVENIVQFRVLATHGNENSPNNSSALLDGETEVEHTRWMVCAIRYGIPVLSILGSALLAVLLRRRWRIVVAICTACLISCILIPLFDTLLLRNTPIGTAFDDGVGTRNMMVLATFLLFPYFFAGLDFVHSFLLSLAIWLTLAVFFVFDTAEILYENVCVALVANYNQSHPNMVDIICFLFFTLLGCGAKCRFSQQIAYDIYFLRYCWNVQCRSENFKMEIKRLLFQTTPKYAPDILDNTDDADKRGRMNGSEKFSGGSVIKKTEQMWRWIEETGRTFSTIHRHAFILCFRCGGYRGSSGGQAKNHLATALIANVEGLSSILKKYSLQCTVVSAEGEECMLAFTVMGATKKQRIMSRRNNNMMAGHLIGWVYNVVDSLRLVHERSSPPLQPPLASTVQYNHEDKHGNRIQKNPMTTYSDKKYGNGNYVTNKHDETDAEDAFFRSNDEINDSGYSGDSSEEEEEEEEGDGHATGRSGAANSSSDVHKNGEYRNGGLQIPSISSKNRHRKVLNKYKIAMHQGTIVQCMLTSRGRHANAMVYGTWGACLDECYMLLNMTPTRNVSCTRSVATAVSSVLSSDFTLEPHLCLYLHTTFSFFNPASRDTKAEETTSLNRDFHETPRISHRSTDTYLCQRASSIESSGTVSIILDSSPSLSPAKKNNNIHRERPTTTVEGVEKIMEKEDSAASSSRSPFVVMLSQFPQSSSSPSPSAAQQQTLFDTVINGNEDGEIGLQKPIIDASSAATTDKTLAKTHYWINNDGVSVQPSETQTKTGDNLLAHLKHLRK
jgi:hypothetical protein